MVVPTKFTISVPEVPLDLGAQLESFDEAVWIALAAYNGGPGNAERWSGGDYSIDPDLFFERVSFSETREYLRRPSTPRTARSASWTAATP